MAKKLVGNMWGAGAPASMQVGWEPLHEKCDKAAPTLTTGKQHTADNPHNWETPRKAAQLPLERNQIREEAHGQCLPGLPSAPRRRLRHPRVRQPSVYA